MSVLRVRTAYLIGAAAVCHLLLTTAIYLLGRFALLPDVFDANGTGMYFATDGFAYRAESISMADILAREGASAWLATPAPFHVRAYSLSYAIFGPVFGFNVLSAEPLNLFCYLATLVLIFKLAEEVFDRRVGLLAAFLSALWPSLLLHSTQVLRDPLFQLTTLALVLTCTTWLTRDYSWRAALASGVLGGVMAALLWVIRINMWGIVPAIILLGAAWFTVRQINERRIIFGNLLGVVVLLVLTALIPKLVPRPVYYMTQPNGAPLVENKDLPAAALGPPALAYEPRAEQPSSVWQRPGARVGDARAGFTRQYPQAGSNIDTDVQLNSMGDVIGYLPRAMAIGLFAPFPDTWLAAGDRVGLYGRLLSGLETLAMYCLELLALACLWPLRRRLSAWLLLSIVLLCVTALGLVVTNVAALYRMRYTFWMLLIILGSQGLIKIAAKVLLTDGYDQGLTAAEPERKSK
jgi:hypothetical protein